MLSVFLKKSDANCLISVELFPVTSVLLLVSGYRFDIKDFKNMTQVHHFGLM
jgi:hypothetical protein